ncbi:hypothetical protein BDZ85DRAFT_46355 [Elsinoe ampelina]|uniref:G-patch domain-containing protein n=1 Tax=Elsinoe ampelina TaxID=302913 RepID=A0A6A6G0L9_9PEZI|nr:hypothetical protein BDZ85DRAFT_46355 [Elsinoe ampelina]
MSRYEDEEYEVPLVDQRYFGAGIKRKRVPFVAASHSDEAPIIAIPTTSGEEACNTYLNIVLKRKSSVSPCQTGADETVDKASDPPEIDPSVCLVCNTPVTQGQRAKEHAGSITHQVCLPHSHPPSSLDRQRKGLNMLESHGWDPDRRQGLGATGQGILHPVRAQEKPDRHGLGHNHHGLNEAAALKSRPSKKPQQRLDAGKVRRLDEEFRRKDAHLRDLFYRDEDVEKYLGGQA